MQQDINKKNRHIFISLSKFKSEYKKIPKDVIDNALFFFGSKRCWIWPENKE